MKRKKWGYWVLSGLLVVAFLTYQRLRPQRQELTLGLSTGSPWGVPSANSYKMLNYLIRHFKQSHPNVTVHVESGITKSDYGNWLANKLLFREEPDLYLVPESDFNALAADGALQSLNTRLAASRTKSRFYPAALAAGQYHGKQYALPYEQNPTFMLVNLDLLKQRGLRVPGANWTPSQFQKIISKITRPSHQIYGITARYDWKLALASYHTSLFTAKNQVNLNRPRTRRALSLMENLNIINAEQNVTSADFDEGRVAFTPLTLAQYRSYTNYPFYVSRSFKFNSAIIRNPCIAKHAGTPLATALYGISSRSHNSKLAWEFLKMMTTDSAVQTKLMADSQGASVLKTVVKNPHVISVIQTQTNSRALTSAKLDQILETGIQYPKFRGYYQTMVQANYIITQGIKANNLDTKLFEIQSQLNHRRN